MSDTCHRCGLPFLRQPGEDRAGFVPEAHFSPYTCIARLKAELAAERARVAVLMEALGQIRHDAGDCGDEETVGFIDSAFVAVLLASPTPEAE